MLAGAEEHNFPAKAAALAVVILEDVLDIQTH